MKLFTGKLDMLFYRLAYQALLKRIFLVVIGNGEGYTARTEARRMFVLWLPPPPKRSLSGDHR